MERLALFCDVCMDEVLAQVLELEEDVSIRGEAVQVICKYVVCPRCNERIAEPSLTDENLEKAYAAYRDKMSIPQPGQLRELRESYGFSQRQFAELIGIGVASLQRYERGSLATDSHAEILRNSFDRRYLKKRFRAISHELAPRDAEAISKALDGQALTRTSVTYQIVSLADLMPVGLSIFTGNVRFQEKRLREALVYLASSCHDLYRTKLNKALFYLDFSSFRDMGTGFTGLQYARASYGPVPDGYEALLAEYVNGVDLAYEEREDGGQVVVALRAPSLEGLSAAELRQLEMVAGFVNRFPTAGALSRYSHEEDAWRKVGDGCLISYEHARTLRMQGV